MTSSRWTAICAGVALLFAALVGFVFWTAPRDEDGIRWTDQFVAGGWMAWTLPVALFFIAIAALLALMALLALRYPETPRVGVLRIETTRGDRLFITLLGSAFICLAWLYAFGADGPPLWGALILCCAYGAAVFRWV